MPGCYQPGSRLQAVVVVAPLTMRFKDFGEILPDFTNSRPNGSFLRMSW
jgi:hypothetical protein